MTYPRREVAAILQRKRIASRRNFLAFVRYPDAKMAGISSCAKRLIDMFTAAAMRMPGTLSASRFTG
jgi:hypothetical protein